VDAERLDLEPQRLHPPLNPELRGGVGRAELLPDDAGGRRDRDASTARPRGSIGSWPNGASRTSSRAGARKRPTPRPRTRASGSNPRVGSSPSAPRSGMPHEDPRAPATVGSGLRQATAVRGRRPARDAAASAVTVQRGSGRGRVPARAPFPRLAAIPASGAVARAVPCPVRPTLGRVAARARR
jgi:hypothetical protein